PSTLTCTFRSPSQALSDIRSRSYAPEEDGRFHQLIAERSAIFFLRHHYQWDTQRTSHRALQSEQDGSHQRRLRQSLPRSRLRQSPDKNSSSHQFGGTRLPNSETETNQPLRRSASDLQ